MRRRTFASVAAWLAGTVLVHAQTLEPIVVGPADMVPIQSMPTTSNFQAAPPAMASAAPMIVTEEATGSSCGRGGGLYGNVDYLLFVFRDGPAPPLIQHLPTSVYVANPTNPDASQAITMYGDGIRQHHLNGLHLDVGYWLSECAAFEVGYTQFETKSKRFYIQSNGDPSIGRHYIDLTNNSQPLTYLIYSDPRPTSATAGYINAEAPVRLWYTDANVRVHGYSVCAERTDYLVGFRYVDLRDSIVISDYTTDGVAALAGIDSFAARNQFYGAQVGFNSFYSMGKFGLDVTGKFAMGGVRQRADIDGSTTESVRGAVTRVTPGNVLTQPTNIGTYEQTEFAVVPEFGVKLGYQIGSRANINIGYNVIAVSSVVRAGSAIDVGINPNNSTYLTPASNSTVPRPGAVINGTDFWAQGLTLGFTLNY